MIAVGGPRRWAWAEIDLTAIEHNVRAIRDAVAPAGVWAVVKANGYGHGAAAVAERAVRAGAEGLCVALVAEGAALRDAGVDAPILVLSEQPREHIDQMITHRLTPTAYTPGYVDAWVGALGKRAAAPSYPIHVKVDTGMQRVGVDADSAAAFVARVAALTPTLRLEGVYTHLACADEPDAHGNAEQLARFDAVLGDLASTGITPALVHAANSAGALALPASRHSLVRAGIAIYGISPGPGVDHLVRDLRPALSLRARVSFVKRVRAGSHVSYGWRHRFERDTNVATLPLGYADGVPRRLGTGADWSGADVLIGGRRCPIVGVVTMDQLMVDVGDAEVAVGDDAVLIGRHGDHVVRAEDWADRLGTIGYEIVCAISARVPRVAIDP